MSNKKCLENMIYNEKRRIELAEEEFAKNHSSTDFYASMDYYVAIQKYKRGVEVLEDVYSMLFERK